MIEAVRDVLRILHVVAVVYWLGADVVVFYLGFGVRDRSTPVPIRYERLRIMKVMDRFVGVAFLAVLGTGLLLLWTLDFTPLRAEWFRLKLGLAALIVVAGVLLVRGGTISLLARSLAATAAGSPEAASLEDEAWRRRTSSRAYVLMIYTLGIVVLAISILRT
jgi:uncharacterized membrane protein